MRVLRDGPDNSQSELPCITRPLWLRTVTHRPVGPTGLYICIAHLCLSDYTPIPSFGGFGYVRVFYFDQYYIFIILNII
jgi:hypothetical protein